MDSKRSHDSISKKPSTTSFGNRRAVSLSEVNWNVYRQRLVRSNIKQKAQRWYAFRAEALLKAFPGKSISQIAVEDVEVHLREIVSNPVIKEWQALQTIDAIQIQ